MDGEIIGSDEWRCLDQIKKKQAKLAINSYSVLRLVQKQMLLMLLNIRRITAMEKAETKRIADYLKGIQKSLYQRASGCYGADRCYPRDKLEQMTKDARRGTEHMDERAFWNVQNL